MSDGGRSVRDGGKGKESSYPTSPLLSFDNGDLSERKEDFWILLRSKGGPYLQENGVPE